MKFLELSFWLVEDQRTDESFFAVTMQLNGYDTKEINEEGIMEGYIDQENFKYRLLMVREDGTVKEDTFTYQDKTKLQTQLISPMYAGKPGYYTDDLRVYPSAVFPLVYPFFTALLGLILTFCFLPYKLAFIEKETEDIE